MSDPSKPACTAVHSIDRFSIDHFAPNVPSIAYAEHDFVPLGAGGESGDRSPEDSLYQWGPDVPDDFLHHTEA